MKLYSHPFSQHSRRVRMLCDELGLEIEVRNISLEAGEHKAERFLKLNPTGRVPVLECKGLVLAESHAIMKYLATINSAAGLYPADAKQRANIDMWLDWNHTKLNPPVQTLAIQSMSMGENADQALIQSSRDEAESALGILENAMRSGKGPGGAVTLADLSLASTVALFEMAGEPLGGMPAISDWMDRIKSRPSFTNTSPTPG